MPRHRTVAWTYECDDRQLVELGQTVHLQGLTVRRGDRCSTGRSTVVNDQGDADAVARQQGWTVGRRVLCPIHAGGDGA